MIRTARRSIVLLAMTVALASLATGMASAKGPGGGGGGGGHHSSGTPTGTFTLVLLNGATEPHYGGQVTFNVTSNAQYPLVTLTCYQGGPDWVTNQTVGFYPGWAWSQNFPLSSWKWTSGAADCNARLYSQNADGSNQQTLQTMAFHVYE